MEVEKIEIIPNQNQDKVCEESMQNLFCRICFQNDNESYIKPCRCAGNLEFVHDKCLSLWVLTKLPNIDNVKCEICLEKFEFITKRKCFFNKNIRQLSEYKKYRNVTIFCLIVLVFSIIILIGLKVYFTKVHKKM